MFNYKMLFSKLKVIFSVIFIFVDQRCCLFIIIYNAIVFVCLVGKTMWHRWYLALTCLMFVMDSCVGVGIITMATTKYIVHEGDQVDIQLLRQGTAASSVNVVVQVRKCVLI